ncbi:MAG: hypothetical protein K0S78_3135, partial [Thermomicrobiales bacterium]|nr:hypothetical protein [Thermomicrobiales bacterium]
MPSAAKHLDRRPRQFAENERLRLIRAVAAQEVARDLTGASESRAVVSDDLRRSRDRELAQRHVQPILLAQRFKQLPGANEIAGVLGE